MTTPLSSFLIRDCHEEDIERVLELWRQADATPSITDNGESIQRALRQAHVLLAEVHGAVVGSIIGTFDGWRGNIYRLAVDPRFRRLGIARALVGEVENRLVREGAKRVTALVEHSHPWAVAFWTAVGYGRDERISRHVRTIGKI